MHRLDGYHTVLEVPSFRILKFMVSCALVSDNFLYHVCQGFNFSPHKVLKEVTEKS